MQSKISRMAVGLAIFCSLFLANAVADPILSIQPPSTSVIAGSTFAVDVNISNVSDLFAFQFDINFTPGILSAISITEGSFLPSGGTTFFLPGTIDNTGGSIAFNADTLIGPIPGVSGSGTLAILDFTALASGTSPISILNVGLLDSTLSPIPFGTVDGSANISGATGGTVPEPATILLLLAQGIAVGLALKWKYHNQQV